MKDKVIDTWKHLIEKRFFGVCTYLGEHLRMKDSRIRLYFIYASFLTFGSPILVYLGIAFWMEVKKQVFTRRPSVWDL